MVGLKTASNCDGRMSKIAKATDIPKDGVKKYAFSEPSCRRIGYLILGTRGYLAVIAVLLYASIACSVAPMFGTDRGWAIWHQSHFKNNESPYTSLIKMIIKKHPVAGLEMSDLDVLNKLLPHISASITVNQGWLLTVSKINLNVHEGKPISKLFRATAEKILPESMHDEFESILSGGENQQESLYEGDGKVARYTGLFAIGMLGISIALAITVLFIWMVKGIEVPAALLLEKSWIIAVILHFAIIVEYVVLAYGAHRSMARNPVTQHGYIPRPDWAWIAAMCSAVCWWTICILSRKSTSSEGMPENTLHAPVPEQCWGIPVSYEDTIKGDTIKAKYMV